MAGFTFAGDAIVRSPPTASNLPEHKIESNSGTLIWNAQPNGA
jgi:hypothetical protein